MLEKLDVLTLRSADADALDVPDSVLTLRRVFSRSTTHLLLEYTSGSDRLVPGQWMSDPDELARIAAKTARGCPDAPPRVVGTELGPVLLQPRGADRRLTGLRPMLEHRGATLLSHRPERRAVVRLEHDGDVRYAKVVRPSKVAGLVDAARRVEAIEGRCFDAPVVLEADETNGVVILSALAGRSLHELLTRGERIADDARAAGAALRSLHGGPVEAAATHGADDEIRLLEKRLADLEILAPAAHAEVAGAAPAVFTALAETPNASTLIHRDFYDKQIFLAPDGSAGLLDFDTLAAGEPALDVANMLVHLELRVLQKVGSPDRAARIADAFLAGYEAGPDVMNRLSVYCDATRLRLACLYALRPKWRSLVGEILRADAPLFQPARPPQET